MTTSEPQAEPATPRPSEPAAKPKGSLPDLFGVLTLVFAALQLIPLFVPHRSQWPMLTLGVVVIGAAVFAILQVAKTSGSARRHFIPALVLVVIASAGAGFQVYRLRGYVEELETELATHTGAGPIGAYLEEVVKQRDAQWDGQFERKYARPTLYLLNAAGTQEHPPIDMRDEILRWRTGTEGMSREFRGVAGLVGDALLGEKLNAEQVIKGVFNYVDRPLADSDLLNKRSGPTNALVPADDIPQRVLVVGDPAAGKSAMLERLDLIQARRARGSRDEPVPVLISLGGIKHAAADAILVKVRERLGEAAESVLATRKVILMLDALDEAADPVETAAAINAIADDPRWDRIIVSVRTLNYSLEIHSSKHALWRHGFVTAIMYGLDQTAIEKQILTQATPEARKKMLMTLAKTSTRAAWLQFLRLPLNSELVSALIMETDTDVLPRGQAELMGGFIRKRFEHKLITVADGEDCQEILSQVGVNLVRGGSAGRKRDFVLTECLEPDDTGTRNTAAQQEHAQTRLAQILETGIIHRTRNGGYRFFHLNVQDYFTARGLRDLSVIDAADVDWREILLFRAGMQDGAAIVEIVRRRLASAETEVLKDYLEKLLSEAIENQPSRS